MQCAICRGVVRPGSTTITLERGQMLLVIKRVPARVCEDCGEAYVEDVMARQLLQVAEEAAGNGVRVSVREYVAA